MEHPLQSEIRGQTMDEKVRIEEIQLQNFINNTHTCTQIHIHDDTSCSRRSQARQEHQYIQGISHLRLCEQMVKLTISRLSEDWLDLKLTLKMGIRCHRIKESLRSEKISKISDPTVPQPSILPTEPSLHTINKGTC